MRRTNVFNAIEAQKYSALAYRMAVSQEGFPEQVIHYQKQQRNWGILARQHLLRHLAGEA